MVQANRTSPRALCVMLLLFTAAVMQSSLQDAAGARPIARERTGDDHAAANFSTFIPSKHGFRFVNSFKGSPIGGLAGLAASELTGGSYGLCGGMSAAAADAFIARRSIPTLTTPPAAGTPLYTYLLERQTDSFAGMQLPARFAAWTGLSEFGPLGTRTLTIDPSKQIADRVRAGQPAVLGLVYAGVTNGRKIWDNHQVLGFALTTAQDERTLRVRVYDPNYPGNDRVTIDAKSEVAGFAVSPMGLPIAVEGLTCQRSGSGRVAAPVRGYFMMPYTPAEPKGFSE